MVLQPHSSLDIISGEKHDLKGHMHPVFIAALFTTAET